MTFRLGGEWVAAHLSLLTSRAYRLSRRASVERLVGFECHTTARAEDPRYAGSSGLGLCTLATPGHDRIRRCASGLPWRAEILLSVG